ncbi:MAG: uncharacterized BrkB/YihY/UPF0761 family membrane protein [Planctomycetota bacterium]|jgi:uncharacterized BrkB/YihY/UPF0761 family membrane protein
MNRIEKSRKQDVADRRSRWWRDGLVCAFVGALAGLVGSVTFSVGSPWLIPVASATGGVLGAIFGDRILPFFNW